MTDSEMSMDVSPITWFEYQLSHSFFFFFFQSLLTAGRCPSLYVYVYTYMYVYTYVYTYILHGKNDILLWSYYAYFT